jgi:hypothetical protein
MNLIDFGTMTFVADKIAGVKRGEYIEELRDYVAIIVTTDGADISLRNGVSLPSICFNHVVRMLREHEAKNHELRTEA